MTNDISYFSVNGETSEFENNTTKHTYTDKNIHFPGRIVVAEISCQLHTLLQ